MPVQATWCRLGIPLPNSCLSRIHSRRRRMVVDFLPRRDTHCLRQEKQRNHVPSAGTLHGGYMNKLKERQYNRRSLFFNGSIIGVRIYTCRVNYRTIKMVHLALYRLRLLFQYILVHQSSPFFDRLLVCIDRLICNPYLQAYL